ncbi:UNVERIFIED_CONTAM: MaoC/PaaZ C-terminal domain-containing protein, partial [Bacteroidetes bacterium 56_B9]
MRAPLRSASYSSVSRDGNPIHTSPFLARFAGLPGTIVHGMHLSAMVRRATEWLIGDHE